MWYGSECWSCKCIECFSPNMFSPHEIGSVKDLSCRCSSIQDILRTRMVFSAIFWMACMFVCYTRVKKNEYMVIKNVWWFRISCTDSHTKFRMELTSLLFVLVKHQFHSQFFDFFFLYILIFFHRIEKIPSTLRFM